MFLLESYPSILLHFKSLSRIFKKNSSGWYELFCPYCDDATRKINPNHGHFNLAPDYPFAHCFRCGIKVGLVKVLKDTNFPDLDLIYKIANENKIVYNSSKKIQLVKTNNNISAKLALYTQNFYSKYKDDFLLFRNYINKRCGEINPLDYFLIPNYIQHQPVVQILNSNNKICTNRFIYETEKRYYIPPERSLYYFQTINDIISYDNIVFCEGAFDLINLHKYNSKFKNAFFIAIGGSNYKTAISSIVSNFLLIGNYMINIVFDKNVNNIDNLCQQIMSSIAVLNPNINFKFFIPILYKDVSDCNLLEQIM